MGDTLEVILHFESMGQHCVESGKGLYSDVLSPAACPSPTS
jgi:hypothetical protein